MKVTVIESFCGIEEGTPLDLPKDLASPLIEQGYLSEHIEAAPGLDHIDPPVDESVITEDIAANAEDPEQSKSKKGIK
ncbi:hypothetical protein [Pedobacter cryoconitis]|uniref:Uncharacterized protein n=1 Tax=Pedobacter cryoconitis TaxID=188932 RepID=A0A327SM83_9SPHI|nr:hypothetical protein [Pedobacter cryoconitis]RAJ28874.1 hypothetical protein LY11_03148 [Pedobacter cryoconitis]